MFNTRKFQQRDLGLLHFLNGLLNKVLALDFTKSLFGKQIQVGEVVTNNLNKSVAISSFQKKSIKSLLLANSTD